MIYLLDLVHNFFDYYKIILNYINNIIYLQNNSYYMKDFNYFQNLKKNENFQILINSYLLKNYNIFNNVHNVNILHYNIFNEQYLYLFIQNIFLYFESFFVGIQKLLYDYNDYIKSLLNFYYNYKILIYKNFINSNLIEDVYYNNCLELLLDAQNETSKWLLWLVHNKINTHNLLEIHFKKAILRNLDLEIHPWLNMFMRRDFYPPDDSKWGQRYLWKFWWKFWHDHITDAQWYLKQWYKNKVYDKVYDTWIYLRIFNKRSDIYNTNLYYYNSNIQKLSVDMWKKINLSTISAIDKKSIKEKKAILRMYKKYARINILSQGLIYDLNIFTSKYYKNDINTNIWNNKLLISKHLWKNDKYIDKIISVSIKHWYPTITKYREEYVTEFKMSKEYKYLYEQFYNKHFEFLEKKNFAPITIKRGFLPFPAINKKERLSNLFAAAQQREYFLNIFYSIKPYIIETYGWYNYIKNIFFNNPISNIIFDSKLLKKSFIELENKYNNLNFTFENLEKEILEKKNLENKALENKVLEKEILKKKILEKEILEKKILENKALNKFLENKFSNKENWKKKHLEKILAKKKDLLISIDKKYQNDNFLNFIFPSIFWTKNNPTIPIKYAEYTIENTINVLNFSNFLLKKSIENVDFLIKKSINGIKQEYIQDKNFLIKGTVELIPKIINHWKNLETFTNYGVKNFKIWGGYSNYWLYHQDLGEDFHIKDPGYTVFYGKKRTLLFIPYNWLKVDIKLTMDAFNNRNYLWMHKNPANIESMSEMAYCYLKPNSLVHKKLVLNSTLMIQHKAEFRKAVAEGVIKIKGPEGISDSEFKDWFSSRLHLRKYRRLFVKYEDDYYTNRVFFKQINPLLEKQNRLKKNFLAETKFVMKITNIEKQREYKEWLNKEKWNTMLRSHYVKFKESEIDKYLKIRDPLNLSGRRRGTEFFMVESRFRRNTEFFTPHKDTQKWGFNFNTLVMKPTLRATQKVELEMQYDELDFNNKDLFEDYVEPLLLKYFKPKKVFELESIHGFKKWLKDKSTIKNTLLSNDMYPVVTSEESNLKNNHFFKKSLPSWEFRQLRKNSVFSIKKKKDIFDYIKFKYNKPDILDDLYYHIWKFYSQKRTTDKHSLYNEKNLYTNIWEVDIWKLNKARKIYVDKNTYWVNTKDKIYDIVRYIDQNKYKNLSKKNQKNMYNLLLNNKLTLDLSKNIYKISSKEFHFNWLRENIEKLYIDNDYMTTQYFLKKNPSVKSNISYTEINNITEFLPLKMIISNKNFYGNFINSDRLDSNLLNDYKFGKNTNILLKKSYIIQLLNVYQKEEQFIANFIWYKIKKEELKILYSIIKNYFYFINDTLLFFFKSWKRTYMFFIDFFKEELIRISLKNKQIKIILKYYNLLSINLKNYSKYIIILIFILFYCIISSLLIILIKSFLPKNMIYGINIKKQKNFIKEDAINQAIKYVENLTIEDLKNQVYDLKNSTLKNLIKKDLLKNIEKIENINNENLKNLKLENALKNISIKKNFFDPETRYIYSWDERYEEKNLIQKGIKNFKKIKVSNKFEDKKKKDLKKNYLIFYKKFFFEKNLEKWENNTKFRLEDPLDWYVIMNTWFFRLKKLFESFKRDKKYNHNRIVFWEDPTLDEWNKITYVYIIPKPFFNFFFVIKFIIGSIKLWNISHWIQKWKQYVMYGIRTKVSYKELREYLEKEWSLEWYKNNSDYNAGMYLKNMMKIAEKYNNIKKFAINNEIFEKKKEREKILNNILTLILEEDKFKEISQYLKYLDKLKLDRIENNFNNKFSDINKKLILDIETINPKKWKEQEIRHKYKDIIFKKKLEIEKEEYQLLKQSYTKRVRRDSDDKKKTLQVLDWVDEKRIKTIFDKKIATLEYERTLRASNFQNHIIDEALDLKETVFFEAIKEYNKDLSDALLEFEELEKEEKKQEQITEKKIKTLYDIYNKYYPYYRKWTTMGSRINYILAQIIMIFTGWIDNFKRIRKNEYNIQNIFKIMWIDMLAYIYKMYWEFIIIFKEYDGLKKWGLNIKTILKFSIIFTPILLYSFILYLILIIFFWWNFTYIKTKKVINNLIKLFFKKLKSNLKTKILKKKFINLKKIFGYIKYFLNIFILLFKNLETGHTILDSLYLKFYNICAILQRNIYFIKGAFFLKYYENKSIKAGLLSVKEYLILKYNSIIELRKNKIKYSWKQKLFKKKDNIIIKMELLIILLDIEFYLKKNKIKILKKIHQYLIFPIFKINWKDFYVLYKKNMELYIILKKNLQKNLNLIILLKNIKIWDLFKLIVKSLFKLIILPFSYIIKHQQNKYINNYKNGIQGFRNNPMYLVLDNAKKKKNWKTKLHDILMKRKISKYLQNLLETKTHTIEMFFMFKIFEVKWTKKNYYQDFFWRKWYWYLKTYKKKILNWLIEHVMLIEESYQNFEEVLETQNWNLWERCRYAYHTYKIYNHVMTRNIQRNISRNLFFYKKAKERDQLIRIYFIKGIINWISYITTNKVVFTTIKDLKFKKIKHKNFKYYIKYIKGTIHISTYLEEMPPQFWALIIIYNKYYRYLLKYVYTDASYPKKWEENKNWEYSKDYKWRLASPTHDYDIPFYDRRFIAADINSFHFKEFISSLANQPYDPLIRWVLFVLEYGVTTEVLIEEGNKIFIDKVNKNLKNDDTWGDISLTHLLTYNKNTDEYNYEIKEFDRLIEGIDFLKIAEHTLERDKMRHYFNKFKNVKDRIFSKNENILQNILKQRKLQKAKMLHRALLRNKLKTQIELEEEQAEENNKEYFYVKKKEFFEEELLEQYWNWQAHYDSKLFENKYFNLNDIWDATYNAHTSEEYYLAHGKLINYTYLIDHIVLQSYDETLEEIYSFLMFKVWTVLEKNLKKNNKKKKINYKHLRIDDNILSRLNYTEHKELKNIQIVNEKTGEKTTKEIYEYKYSKINWEPLRIHNTYNYIENNLLGMYYEVGDVFTYQDKIEFNIEALRFQRKDKYHEQEILLKLLNIISERKKKLKDIKRNVINQENNSNQDFKWAFINNVKWSWEQWLVYINIDNENDILNKNIIIFNERYNLWNLKRVPIRLKLPVMLDIETDSFIQDFLEDDSYFVSNSFYLMSSTVTPILKQSLEWEQCKVLLEKHFNKNIQDVILWLFTADLFNKEVLKIKRDYKFLLKNFTQNYGVFHKLYFIGLPHYSWDLLRYHEIWIGEEDFPYDKYFQLKQIEFLNHDPAAKKIIERLHNIFIDKYKPISFIFFFKYQFFYNYSSHILNIVMLSNIIFLLKNLFYNPGELIGNNYLLFGPILFIYACFYLKKQFRKLKDLDKGLEIYLYKYRSSKIYSISEWNKIKLNLDKNKRAWIEHFYDKDKIQEVFGSRGSDALISNRDPEWWRYHTHFIKSNELSKYKHVTFLFSILLWYFLLDFWGLYKHRYRNSKLIWDYYRINDEAIKLAQQRRVHLAKGYNERIWIEDSWTRLENGNSLFCKWYGDFYKKLRHVRLRDLDYGNVGDAKNINFELCHKAWNLNKELDFKLFSTENNLRILNYSTGFSDSHWLWLTRFLEKLIVLDRIELTNIRLIQDNLNAFHKEIIAIYSRSRLWHSLQTKRVLTRTDLRHKRLFYKSLEKKVSAWIDTNRNGYGFYYKEISSLRDDYLYFINRVDDFYFFKKELRDTIGKAKKDYYRWRLGNLYDYYFPKDTKNKWPEFIQWVKDEYDYDLKDINHLYSNFLTTLQEQIYPLIWKDIQRYSLKKDAYIFGDYYKEVLKKKEEMYFKHKECFETGKTLDINILLEITEKEKHYHNFCYHLVKYKLDRIIILKKTDPSLFRSMLWKQYNIPEHWMILNDDVIADTYNTYNALASEYKNILKEQYFGSSYLHYFSIKRRIEYISFKINNKIKQYEDLKKWKDWLDSKFFFSIDDFGIETKKAVLEEYLKFYDKILSNHNKAVKIYNIDSMLVKFLRKKGRYIKNINKDISKSEIVDYKIKLLINFFKEKTNFWIFWENFSIKSDIIELFMILVKLILKIFG